MAKPSSTAVIDGFRFPVPPDVEFHQHVVATVGAHAASAISYAGGPVWADGTTNPAANVEAQIDKIIQDLSTGAGAEKIAYAGGPSWADGTTNPATTLGAEVNKIIEDLARDTATSGAKHIGCEARSSWLGGRANPAGVTLFAAIDKIISDLGASDAADDGARRIGAEGYAGLQYTLNSGSVRSQLNEIADNFAVLGSFNQFTQSNQFVNTTAFGNSVSFSTGQVWATSGLTEILVDTLLQVRGLGGGGSGLLKMVGGGTGSPNWPLLENFGSLTRHQPLIIVGMQTSTSATISMDGGHPRIDTPLATAADAFLLDLSSVPDGATVDTVTITTIGLGATNDPASKASYVLQRETDGVLQDISSTYPDGHTYGGGGNWLTTARNTVITTLGGGLDTIDKSSYTYFIKVNSPYDAIFTAQMRVVKIVISYTLTKLVI